VAQNGPADAVSACPLLGLQRKSDFSFAFSFPAAAGASAGQAGASSLPGAYHAATKAGIHRKTLEYWLRRSAAGDAGYDIEWQGIEWRFHEHCTSAIDEADDSLRAVMWQIAMGVVSKTDENGNFIVEACGQPNMKMARHFLEWQRPEKRGKRRKRDVPHNAGVLVIGGDVTKKPEYGLASSALARANG
jgi:hypothetical protein